MAIDAKAVVFVGLPEIAKIVGLTRTRIHEIADNADSALRVLGKNDAVIGGRPAWLLSPLLARLVAAGYEPRDAVVAALREKRSVPAGSIPVGIAEAAEILRTSVETTRSRVEAGTSAAVLFKFGRDRALDLNELVAKAAERGHSIDHQAAQKWRQINSGGTAKLGVVASVRLVCGTTDDDQDIALREAVRLLQSPELLNAALSTLGLRVVATTVESIEPLPI
ncbi:hypothetical protein KGQ20_04205 [Catenulispora sp. NF23]|uniref:Uncharacterized protein n=1 Tax=Catenulispora pinistramenti TaxID=2705254 RepID=A0ABS5KJT6_9ACTN|nr:hypothetical protein [Catenulispora pinistramenti]MBS2531967.1 hypothetical protein [Catenulispora pinistramenti]MBS2546235.1 hypothetical protein [Catenulispora pinistramenti]